MKLVYIDPPFNTEQTFEHYADQLEHSIWLTMMRDRVRDIKPLLAPDATVWVHLDDAEVHRMRVLLDEEFGADNFVASIAWRKRTSVANDSQTFTSQHDTILVYGKSGEVRINRVERALTKDDARYKSVDGDPRLWGTFGNTSAPKNTSAGRQVSACYGIQHPLTGKMIWPPRGGQWAFRRDRIRTALDEYAEWADTPPDVAERCAEPGLLADQVRMDVTDLTVVDLDAARVSTAARIEARVWPEFFVQPKAFGRKVYQAAERTSPPSTWWPDTDVGHNREAKAEIKALFPGVNPFATPKPERLLARIVDIGSEPGDLVLDCFAGSGTTAAVAHKMGRRWLTIELQQNTADTFIVPRLSRVCDGTDAGGVTSKSDRVAVGDLPDGVTPREAQDFNTVLSKVVKTLPDLDPKAVKALRAASRTRDEMTEQWSGGGGFTVAKIGPSMYEVDDETGKVFLSAAASNGAWSQAVAGQLGFTLTPEHPVFCGVRRRQRLAVVDGVADEDVVRTVVEHLGERERALVVAKAVLPEAQELLSALSPGSRIRKAPEDMFTKATVR